MRTLAVIVVLVACHVPAIAWLFLLVVWLLFPQPVRIVWR